jgi:A/G-specific adenine glycosylase
MEALPSGDWREGAAPDARAGAPVPAAWAPLPAPVSHVFSHFRLELTVARARVARRPAVEGRWAPIPDAHRGLPSVFAKAVAAARAAAMAPRSGPGA